MADYDVYHLWLGISPHEQPANYYRLLGVPLFEQNPDVIRNAADRQLSHVKRLAVNQFTQVGQKLLDEIATAKLCLLKPEKREIYNVKLREQTQKPAAGNSAPAGPPLPSAPTSELPRKPRPSADNAGSGSVSTWSEVAWIVGSNPSCDIVVELPVVSGIHCKLMRVDEKLFIRDLKSTNGTFVNSRRINGSVEISPLDWLTLGRETRLRPATSFFPQAQRSLRVLFVGRHPACEICREEESVSMLHARIVICETGMSVEDLGSANGTSVLHEADKVVVLPPHTPTEVSGCRALLFGQCKVNVVDLPKS